MENLNPFELWKVQVAENNYINYIAEWTEKPGQIMVKDSNYKESSVFRV